MAAGWCWCEKLRLWPEFGGGLEEEVEGEGSSGWHCEASDSCKIDETATIREDQVYTIPNTQHCFTDSVVAFSVCK